MWILFNQCVSPNSEPQKSKQWFVRINVSSDTSLNVMFNQLFYKIPGKYSGTFWHYNRDAIYHEKKFLKSKFEAEAWQALQMLLTCWTSPVSLWIVKSQRLVCIYVCCCRCQNSQRNLQNCQNKLQNCQNCRKSSEIVKIGNSVKICQNYRKKGFL